MNLLSISILVGYIYLVRRRDIVEWSYNYILTILYSVLYYAYTTLGYTTRTDQ